MKKKIAALAAVGAILLSATAIFAAKPLDKGFDEFGYNLTANNFVGTGSSWCQGKLGWDKATCDVYMGIYANDKLKMSWNEEWDRGKSEGWTDSGGYEGAWSDNQWNGMAGGSGEVWHYKNKWIGSCGVTGTPTPSGGYCIWGQFEVMMDHGTYDGEHYWYTHGMPSGYGAY